MNWTSDFQAILLESIVIWDSIVWLEVEYSEKVSLKNDFAIKPQGIATALGSNFVFPSNAIVFPTSLFVIIGSQSPYACV